MRHQRITKTFKKVQETTNVFVLKKHVKDYIKKCSECAMRKTERLDQIKKLQILKTLEYSYQNIALNFIIELSEFTDLITQTLYDMITTIMNRFTKHARFISCKMMMTAEQLMFLLLRTMFCENDISKKIMSNRDKLFTFKFMKELIQTLEIKQTISTSFHS